MCGSMVDVKKEETVAERNVTFRHDSCMEKHGRRIEGAGEM